MATPNTDEINKVKLNVNNMMDWVNHLHDYLQDVINEVYDKVTESPVYDPSQQFITNITNTALKSLAPLGFPGSGVVSAFLSTFIGSYSGPATPPSLQGSFGSVWDRFSRTFLQANVDLAEIHKHVEDNWNKTYTNPVDGSVGHVCDLGDGQVSIPDKDDTLFQTMTNTALAAYKFNLTRQTLGSKWTVIEDVQGQFKDGSEDDLKRWITEQANYHPEIMVTYWAEEGGTHGMYNLCPRKGFRVTENYLGYGTLLPSAAPADLCKWLFQDDGYGVVTNPNGIAQRRDVFYNWGLQGSRRSARTAMARSTDATINTPSAADRVSIARWAQLFDQTTRQEVEKRIILKSQQDPAFLNQLLNDPKTTLQTFLGLSIPNGITLKVIQETPDTYMLILPWAGVPEATPVVDSLNVGSWPSLFNQTPRQDVEKLIIRKSQQDPAFLRLLIREPKITLEAFLGSSFPDQVTVDVFQEIGDHYRLVLPLIGAPVAD